MPNPKIYPVVLVLASLVMAAACGRTDQSGEIVQLAPGPAPEVQQPKPGFQAAVQSWPLLTDRLRVVGQKRRVLAQPLLAPADAPAHWSYERPRSSLNALALLSPQGRGPVVASMWTDAEIVGLDAQSGDVLWRSPQARFGKEVLSFPYNPGELVGRAGFRPVRAGDTEILVIQVKHALLGVDPGSGAKLWRIEKAGCADDKDGDLPWWPVQGSIVVNATCGQGTQSQGPNSLQVFDARNGTQTQTLNPDHALGPGGVRALGCEDRPADCTGVQLYPLGSTVARKPVAWTVRDGKLVDYGTAQISRTAGIHVHNNDGVQLFGYDPVSFELRWQVDGQTHDLRRRQFFDVDVSGDTAWVASHSWNGGPPALVRIGRADGRITGCQAPPGKAPTRIEAHADGYLIVGDLPTSRIQAYDPAKPDGGVVLLYPEPVPTCPT